MHIKFAGKVRATTAVTILLASLISACSTPQVAQRQIAPSMTAPKKQSTVEEALQLKDDGRAVDAAHALINVYQQSAAADRTRYLFDAAQLYLSVRDTRGTADVLAKMKASSSSSVYTTLLSAQLALLDGELANAMRLLNDVKVKELSAAGKGVYWATMAEAFQVFELNASGAGRNTMKTSPESGQSYVLRALHAYLKAEEFLTSNRDLSANQESIWQLLATQSIADLKSFRTQVADHTERGWIDLSLLSKESKPAGRKKSVAAWRKQYPNHVVLDQRLLDLNNVDKAKLRHLALILPTKSKELGASARAVWEGFKSVQAKTPGPFPVKLYETDEKALSTISAYNTAVDNGAILIVGPLPRSALVVLAKRKLLSVPTVALNVIENETVPVNLYQFGLPISHEAKLIARAAKDRGFTDAVILKGSSALDVRSAEAFAKEWTHLKRSIKAEIASADMAAIARVTGSGNAASTMVFVAADFKNALPGITSMPSSWTVFGTSSMNTTSPDATKLDKARHIYFVDSPSLIKAAKVADQIPATIRKDVVASRLYWLGVDVCRLSALLLNEEVRFNRPVMDGATGTLRVTRSRMVERELQLVSFQEANLARYNVSDFDRLAEVRPKRN